MAHYYKKLEFWKKSKQLSVDIYKLTQSFPQEEKFGLSNQIRRCSVSIASNIAEGSSRRTSNDFKRFIDIAIGSAYELEVQLMISNEVGYIATSKTTEILDELQSVIRMMSKFKSVLR